MLKPKGRYPLQDLKKLRLLKESLFIPGGYLYSVMKGYRKLMVKKTLLENLGVMLKCMPTPQMSMYWIRQTRRFIDLPGFPTVSVRARSGWLKEAVSI